MWAQCCQFPSVLREREVHIFMQISQFLNIRAGRKFGMGQQEGLQAEASSNSLRPPESTRLY